MPRKALVIPMSDSSAAIDSHDVSPTALPDAFLLSAPVTRILAFHMPRYEELPRMALYRDQVITYIQQVFEPLGHTLDEPWITGAMINNYVKSGLVPAPEKKQYGRVQIARLLIICVFKQFLSISAIKRLLTIQRMTYHDQVAFDYMATELEHALASAFGQSGIAPDSASYTTRESLLVRSAAHAFAAKAFLLSYLSYSGIEA